MKQFNALYSLSQRLLNDNNITTLVAVFNADVKLSQRHKLSKFGMSDDNTLKMINGTKQITIKINTMKKIEEDKEYKTCDRCCYDIVDDDGDIMEHICIDDKLY